MTNGPNKPRLPEADPGFCKRCKTTRATVAVRQAVFCQSCFLQGTLLKFRTAVHHFNLHKSAKLMVAFSGGTCSRVMLDLLVRQPVGTSLDVVYVDESDLIPCDADYVRRIQDLLASYKTPFTVLKISDIANFAHLPEYGSGMDPCIGPVLASLKDSPRDATDLLRKQYLELKCNTAKTDFVCALRTCLIQYHAIHHSSTHVVLGTCAQGMAFEILSATIRGNGMHVAELAHSQCRSCSPVILKPMSGFSIKEITLFAYFTHLASIPVKEVTGYYPTRKSFDYATINFLRSMENTKVGTHSTLCRTAARLSGPN